MNLDDLYNKLSQLYETGGANYERETVAASQTDQILGATGAVGDFLAALVIVPATVSPGLVQIQDADGTAITVFAGGTNSLTELRPIYLPLGLPCSGATTPGWKITTGADVSVLAIGDFT